MQSAAWPGKRGIIQIVPLLLISAFVLFSAYRHLPESEEYDKHLFLASFKFLLLGNLVWILAESIEMIIGAVAELIEYKIGRVNTYIGILISLFSMGLFFKGISLKLIDNDSDVGHCSSQNRNKFQTTFDVKLTLR